MVELSEAILLILLVKVNLGSLILPNTISCHSSNFFLLRTEVWTSTAFCSILLTWLFVGFPVSSSIAFLLMGSISSMLFAFKSLSIFAVPAASHSFIFSPGITMSSGLLPVPAASLTR